MSDNRRDDVRPTAFQLQAGDVAGFGWDFGNDQNSVVLYFQPPSLRGSLLQIAMSRDQFLRMFALATEMHANMAAAADAAAGEPKPDEPARPEPVHALAGQES